jgi:hypothetical protein
MRLSLCVRLQSENKGVGMTIGFPEAQAAFEKEYGFFIDEIERVHSLANKLFRHEQIRLVKESDKYIFILAFAANEDFHELFVLAGNGLSVGALKILRGMYEKVITALYLANHPDKTADFAAFCAVDTYRITMRLPVDLRESFLSAARVREIEEDYREVEPRFTNPRTKKIRRSWTPLSLDQLAKEAKDDLDGVYGPLHEAYAPAFVLPSCYIHASLTDLVGRVSSDDEVMHIVDHKTRSPRSTLFHAHLLLLRLFNRVNSHFKWDLNSEVNAVLEGFERCWNRPK